MNAPFTSAHRNGYSVGMNNPRIVVVHIAEGYYAGTISWFKNPLARAATHFVVGKEENQCVQMVKYADAAIHAGWNKGTWPNYTGISPNFISVGIENAGFTGDELTDWQYRCNAWIIAEVAKRYKFEPTPLTVLPHSALNQVSRKNCPGKGVDMGRLIEMAKERMKL